MGKYDGPSFYKQEHSKVEPIKGKKRVKKLPKYQLPESVQTRDDIQKEAHHYMETPTRLNRRFRSTKIPNSLQHLEGWKQSRRNHELIEEISDRLTKETSEYLLFEEFMKEEPKPESKPQLPVEKKSNEVTLVKKDLVNLQFGKKKSTQKKQKKAKAVQDKIAAERQKPNSGLHRSLSNILADDKKAMKQWNSNLDSLFSNEKKSEK